MKELLDYFNKISLGVLQPKIATRLHKVNTQHDGLDYALDCPVDVFVDETCVASASSAVVGFSYFTIPLVADLGDRDLFVQANLVLKRKNYTYSQRMDRLRRKGVLRVVANGLPVLTGRVDSWFSWVGTTPGRGDTVAVWYNSAWLEMQDTKLRDLFKEALSNSEG